MWKELWQAILQLFIKKTIPVVPPIPVQEKPVPTPPAPVLAVPVQPLMPKYLWETKENIRHSIRVICDELGMDVEQKNTMCATIYGESEFNLYAKNYNRSKKTGEILSTDWGLCQWNDYYHGEEISSHDAVYNPEKAVRLMGHYWKKSEAYRNWWIAYKSGRYLQFLKLVNQPM